MTKNVALGTQVSYHGSLVEAHGQYIVVDICTCGHCWEAQDRYYTLYSTHEGTPVRYNLEDENGNGLKHVRLISFTVLDLPLVKIELDRLSY